MFFLLSLSSKPHQCLHVPSVLCLATFCRTISAASSFLFICQETVQSYLILHSSSIIFYVFLTEFSCFRRFHWWKTSFTILMQFLMQISMIHFPSPGKIFSRYLNSCTLFFILMFPIHSSYLGPFLLLKTYTFSYLASDSLFFLPSFTSLHE